MLLGLGSTRCRRAARRRRRTAGCTWARRHETLGVPERVPVVAGPGQALGRDRPVLGPRPGLQDVEQPEAHRLLDLGVTVQLDVGTFPELRPGRRAARPAAVPAGQVGSRQRADHLVDRGRASTAGSTSRRRCLARCAAARQGNHGHHGRRPGRDRTRPGASISPGRSISCGRPGRDPQPLTRVMCTSAAPGASSSTLVFLADRLGFSRMAARRGWSYHFGGSSFVRARTAAPAAVSDPPARPVR